MSSINIDFFQKEIPTKKEWAFIVVFLFILFATLKFQFAVLISVCVFFFIGFIEVYLNDEKFRKKMVKIGKWLFVLLAIMFLTDTFSTYYMVLHKKLAVEGNPIVVFLWSINGVLMGEIIRTFLAIAVFGFVFKKMVSKNKKQSLIAIILLFVFLLAYTYVLDNNLSLLFQETCK